MIISIQDRKGSFQISQRCLFSFLKEHHLHVEMEEFLQNHFTNYSQLLRDYLEDLSTEPLLDFLDKNEIAYILFQEDDVPEHVIDLSIVQGKTYNINVHGNMKNHVYDCELIHRKQTFGFNQKTYKRLSSVKHYILRYLD